MNLKTLVPFFKKHRRYPIQRVTQGRTHRQLAFMMFDYGNSPERVSQANLFTIVKREIGKGVELVEVVRRSGIVRRLPKLIRSLTRWQPQEGDHVFDTPPELHYSSIDDRRYELVDHTISSITQSAVTCV